MPVHCEAPAEPAAIHSTVLTSENGAGADHAKGDPWEGVNRQSYGFSRFVDRHAFRPIAMSYRRWLPGPVRGVVHRALTNLGEPLVFINDIVQLRPKAALHTGGRFVINSTAGLLGAFDVAKKAGLEHHDNDFGLTLARYGAPAGPYIYVPLLGPSSVRDVLGDIVDFVADPLPPPGVKGYDTIVATQTAFEALDTRVELEPDLAEIDATAFDSYATIRSYYVQSRKSEISGGETSLEDMPYFPAGDEPQTTEPQTTEPQSTEPQTTEPQTTEPQSTEPQP